MRYDICEHVSVCNVCWHAVDVQCGCESNKITCIYFFLSFSCHLLWHSARFSRIRWETSSRGAKDEPIMCLNAYVEWHYWCFFILSAFFLLTNFLRTSASASETEFVGNFRLRLLSLDPFDASVLPLIFCIQRKKRLGYGYGCRRKSLPVPIKIRHKSK